jgi:ribosomal protein S18 acetylase RimI-like enzyme
VPVATPEAWRERWAADGARYGQAPLPTTFEDAPNAGLDLDASQAAAEVRSLEIAGVVRRLAVPRLLQVARDRGWWDPVAVGGPSANPHPAAPTAGAEPTEPTEPTIVDAVDASAWEGWTLAARVVSPADADAAHALVLAAIRDGAVVSAARSGSVVVGLAIASAVEADGRRELLALGVAPTYRQRGLAGALLAALMTSSRAVETEFHAEIAIGERDPIEPLDRAVRASIARRLLERAGFEPRPADADLHAADPHAIRAVRPMRG